ncbi:MAG: hypothetical protein SWX82_11385 [Cyanobacteriota bacterium]|nr:hypothetical protein [Cyanobacteriota bacterium]
MWRPIPNPSWEGNVGSVGKNQKRYIFIITMQDNQFFIVVIQRDMTLNAQIIG